MALSVGVAGLRFGMSWARVFDAYDETDLVAVCDIQQERRDEAKEQLGVDVCYAAFDGLVADERIDAVAIFTPAPLHAEHVIRAIRAGKHVLCAVPAALTMDEAKALVEVVSESDRIYMMAENWVYEPSVVRARSLYESQKLGRIYYAEAEYIHGLKALRRHPDGRPTWRNSLQPLLYPTHGTSPYLNMTGDRLVEVMAVSASGRDEFLEGYEADWVQTALFRTEEGAVFRLTNSFQNVHGMSHFLSFYGDEGSFETGRFREARTVCYYSVGNKEQVTREECHHPELSQFSDALGAGHGKTSMLIVLDFVQAVANGSPPPVDLMQALDMTLPGIVGLQAVREDGWVSVPDPRSWL
ncbi:MAG: Gfo/Idh/MocA family oxidoreductase [Gemmatimonadetes bacterium]|nr:Gfo/Idh/MocA family oxidoreductase [Gemmatimonadota bacterium]